jgi:hypothetical protein
MLGSNQRPPRCERGALPLRQSPWRPQTTRLLVAGTLAGQHRLAYPRGAWRRRGRQDRPIRLGPDESGSPIAAARPGRRPGSWPACRREGSERPGQAPGGFPGSRPQGRSAQGRIRALEPLPEASAEPAGGARRALVLLNTNSRCPGIKSAIVVITDKAARKSGHRVVRPTRKAVCCRIGQSTTVRYLNANPEGAHGMRSENLGLRLLRARSQRVVPGHRNSAGS